MLDFPDVRGHFPGVHGHFPSVCGHFPGDRGHLLGVGGRFRLGSGGRPAPVLLHWTMCTVEGWGKVRTRGVACSNIDTQPCPRTFGRPEGGGGRWVPQHTYFKNGPNDALVILNTHKWGKFFFKKFAQPRSDPEVKSGHIFHPFANSPQNSACCGYRHIGLKKFLPLVRSKKIPALLAPTVSSKISNCRNPESRKHNIDDIAFPFVPLSHTPDSPGSSA